MISKSIVFSEPGKTEIREESVPEPGEKELLVRAIKSLISTGTELTAFSGEFPPDSRWANWIKYPFKPGYSNVGEIVKAGPAVRDFKAGEKVVSFAPHTSYAVIDSEKEVWKVPEGISDDEAAFLPVGQIVLNGVRLAKITLGESVAVVGLGLLGQLAVQFARLSGALPLIAVDIAEERLRWAKSSGADCLINPAKENLEKKIGEFILTGKADVVIEVTGNPAVIPQVVKLARQQGRVVLLGSPRGKTEIDFHSEIHGQGLHLIGAHTRTHAPVATPNDPWTLTRDAKLFFELLLKKKIDVKAMVTHRFSYKESQKVYDMLLKEREKTLGVIFDWSR